MRRKRIATLVVLAAVLACGEGPGPGASYVLTVMAGDAQTERGDMNELLNHPRRCPSRKKSQAAAPGTLS